MSNKHFNKYKNKIRCIMHCNKHALTSEKLWSTFHPENRKRFPIMIFEITIRSIKIHNNAIRNRHTNTK